MCGFPPTQDKIFTTHKKDGSGKDEKHQEKLSAE